MPQSVKHLYDSNMHSAPGILLVQGLFGESTHLPDVVHCETIAVRSSLHDWELAPHRHGRLHQVVLVLRGSGMAQLEGRHVPFGDDAVINVPPGAAHAFRFAPGTEGFVVTLADEILDLILAGAGDVRHLLAQPEVCAAHPDMAAIAQGIWSEFNGLGGARALVLRGLCATLLGLCARQLASQGAGGAAQRDGAGLLQRFEALLEERFLAHWGVADYARALSISPTHLSRVVRAAYGMPASQRISARLVREARRRLAYTDLRVATIAYDLGFADPAHFSRVFASATGVSPRAFRQRLEQPRDGAGAAP